MKKWKIGFLSSLTGVIGGILVTKAIENKKIGEKQKKIDKLHSYYSMLIQWMQLNYQGKSMEEYFKQNEIRTIAIYGMGEVGNCLYEELKNTSIEVKYAIDKNEMNTYSPIQVYGIEDGLPDVDAIIITAVFAFDEIMEKLNMVTDMNIISLEDVIFEI